VKRGDIWQVDLSPVRGAEASKVRPVIIVSRDQANQSAVSLGRGVITVVPVTSNINRVYPFQVLLPAGRGLTLASKAQAEQVRAVDVTRFVRQLGRLHPAELFMVERALILHLDLHGQT
jgi:mRNA interferase MazF